MYPPFLTAMLASKSTMLINLESFTKKSIHQLLRDFYTIRSLSLFMEDILASLTPITEEHTKLLDHLSEPSSRLVHHISHPPEEDISAEVVTACFIYIWVHGFSSCIPTSVKRVSLTSQLPRNHLGSKLLSNTGWLSTTLLCRLCFSLSQQLRHTSQNCQSRNKLVDP